MLFTYVKADTFKTVKPRGGGEGRQRAQESRGRPAGQAARSGREHWRRQTARGPRRRGKARGPRHGLPGRL